MTMLIFSTCYMEDESHIDRWLYWFDYYSFFSPKSTILTFYDGEIPSFLVNFKYRSQIISSGNHLGRPIPGNVWVFPGWKKSFREALKYGRHYNKVIHIESDLYIRKKFKNIYLDYFNHINKYYSGYCSLHKMTETALQVLNNKEINEKFISYYSNNDNLYENKGAEQQLLPIAPPEYIFNGERLEKNIDSLLKNDSMEYFGQCSYNRFKDWL